MVIFLESINPASNLLPPVAGMQRGYQNSPSVFHARRHRLNSVLTLCGMSLGEDGQIRRSDTARTIDHALERANRLHAALVQRAVHADVLRFCNAEILQENYFHAVFEAMKSITAKIRRLSGLTKDGAGLVHDAFGQKYVRPLLAINPLLSETRRGEQNGFVNLLKGLYGTIRNPLAHDPKVEWDMGEQDALDILTTISLVHRKLDQAYRYRAERARPTLWPPMAEGRDRLGHWSQSSGAVFDRNDLR
jgi:uncharacterized protein (TIGR02391 family)